MKFEQEFRLSWRAETSLTAMPLSPSADHISLTAPVARVDVGNAEGRQVNEWIDAKLPSAPVRAKLLEVIPRNIRLDVGDSLEHMTDLDCRVFLHQNTASASPRTRSRTPGFETFFRDDIDPASEPILQKILDRFDAATQWRRSPFRATPKG